MNKKNIRLWIMFALVLGLLSIVAGCSPADITDIPVDAESTLSDMGQPSPTGEPSPVTTPEPEFTPTDTLQPETTPTETVHPAPVPVDLLNPGFEEQDGSGMPAGWENAGGTEATLIEERGRSGDFRLTHKSSEAYQVETSQTVSGLENEWYTLRGWARSSGEQNAVYLALQCGGEEKRVHVPSTSPGYRWINLVVSNQASDGECTVKLYSDGKPGTWASFDDIELAPGRAALSILGADISSLKKAEDLGGVYRDADGTEGDALEILNAHGLNYARLRVWVDPPDGYHDKDELFEMAVRLKEQNISLLVDFHYSDHWADPGKQIKPATWQDYDFEQLKQALYDHTYDVCSSLVEQGTPPDMIQVGNEINSGMLWPDGHTWNPPQWDNLAELLREGYQAVKDCSPSTLVMLHIAEGGDNELARWWFGNITYRDVPFDLIGISYYPYWHGTLMELQYNLNDIVERYDKDVIVVETAYAFTEEEDDSHENIANTGLMVQGYPYTPEGQSAMLRDVMAVVRAVPNGRGLGVFWWDATWTAVPGNGWDATDPNSGNAWENQALFDYNDRVLPALNEFLNP